MSEPLPTSQAGYKYLLTYQYSSVIYDLTAQFCQKYLPGRELLRQRDQMTQAARSGKQNIAEGASLESLESYIKLLGVARGSIFELLEDYQDYLRQRVLPLWPKDSKEMRALRDLRVLGEPQPHIPQFPHIPQNPTLAGNLLVMLCQRTTYLREGGFREKLFRKRLEERQKSRH